MKTQHVWLIDTLCFLLRQEPATLLSLRPRPFPQRALSVQREEAPFTPLMMIDPAGSQLFRSGLHPLVIAHLRY